MPHLSVVSLLEYSSKPIIVFTVLCLVVDKNDYVLWTFPSCNLFCALFEWMVLEMRLTSDIIIFLQGGCWNLVYGSRSLSGIVSSLSETTRWNKPIIKPISTSTSWICWLWFGCLITCLSVWHQLPKLSSVCRLLYTVKNAIPFDGVRTTLRVW